MTRLNGLAEHLESGESQGPLRSVVISELL